MHGPIALVVEGDTDAVVARRLLEEAGIEPGPVHVTGGKSRLDSRLRGYNHAARQACWLVLRDLDRDAACAPELVATRLPEPAPHMRLQIAVRAVEAWLLADADRLARALAVNRAKVPAEPERLENPKRALVDLARGSRKRAIREALVPSRESTASVGPGYTSFVTEFAARTWRPEVAESCSPSLRCLRAFLARKAQARRTSR